MGQNIEVKDVHQTEYLDKNGLDMLWAKIKENAHNQVEVERNRAVAKEDSLSQEIASVKPAEGKVFLQVEDAEDGEGTKILKGDSLSFGDYRSQQAFSVVTSAGFSVKKDAQEVVVLPTGIKADVERGSDTKVWNTNGGITDLASYAKKTDIPEVDTSDFVSKSDTITQTINSGLIAMDKLQVFSKGYYDQTASLRGGIFTEGADAKLTLNDTTASHNYMELTASKLVMGQDVGGNTLLITTSGITNTDNNANHVYATDGSIADLAQYAKKNEITADGNVNDVQVNGVTVIENKVANIKPATKESLGVVKVGDGLNVTDGTISVDSTSIGAGNYITYDSIYQGQYYKMSNGLIYQYNNGFSFGNVKIGPIDIEMTANGSNRSVVSPYLITAARTHGNETFINADSIQGRTSNSDIRFKLDENGVQLNGGDNNHVLTSNASTIDITQYVLKSVYDEKIAALEARIAALEAKHAETA